MKTLTARLFVLLQYLLPRYLMTRLFYRLARIRTPWFKNLLIGRFVRLFDVDIAEAARAVPQEFQSFNDFFTRELRDGARPIEAAADSIVSPADGTLSACGEIVGRHVFQAKGKQYSLDDLLAIDLDDADALTGGSFATIYLAPYNYHRVHSPFAGEISGLRYVPGDLFSVNAATVAHLPRLFARNERLLLRIDTAAGRCFVVLVGALNVGSMTTPWTGEIRPQRSGMARNLQPAADRPLSVAKGDLLGWFNMGSTVIVLMPPGTAAWSDDCVAGRSLRMGEAIGRLQPSA